MENLNNMQFDPATFAKAMAFLQAMQGDNGTTIEPLGNLSQPKGGNKTLDDIANDWFEAKKNTVCSATLGTYKTQYRMIQKHFGGDCLVKDITRSQVQSWLNEIRENKTSKSVTVLYSTFKALMSLAELDGHINKNPCDGVVKPRKDNNKKLPATKEQYEALFKIAKKHKTNWILMPLLYYTGCRIGELLALTWDDVDFKNRIIVVNKQYTQDSSVNKSVFKDHTKTKAGMRLVPIPRELMRHLKEYKKDNEDFHYIIHQTFHNKMVQYGHISRLFRSWLDRANISGIFFHSFRHTCTSNLLEMGIPVNVISGIMGHSDITTTLNVYAYKKLSEQDLKDATKTIDNHRY